MGMRRNKTMTSRTPMVDIGGPPHTPGMTAKAAFMAGLVAGAKTPPKTQTRTDGRLGGGHMKHRVASIPPPKLGLPGKSAS